MMKTTMILNPTPNIKEHKFVHWCVSEECKLCSLERHIEQTESNEQHRCGRCDEAEREGIFVP